ncbi:TPA: DsbE family thiol:disulfide interchange protein [Legionella pneumophila]|nr:DsbE family thiol:disulfide interchange protein [Legionella pneumophila]HAU1319556.1 DsbE family thiol:disulfide interchange protein [Legionella pneumophila]HBC0466221.1 DsbE family thiol:disulfide interchange protein [Legionella pneumophila]HBD9373455.1 DsbE family thiol:disulfide interchange protein [Legionella pneumophila]HBI2945176.1 DsbE family thiol:disulfide interchange protein [Legionella pneumophila]
MKKIGWRVIPVAVFCLLCFFLWRGLSLDPHYLPSARIGKPLPDFSLPELQNSDSMFSAMNFHNQVVLLNVWASWCEACVEEQVFMLQLAREGVPIYGLNYKDKPEHARAWLAQWGNPYRLIGQDSEGKVAIDLGVYGAPETFVIDKKGIIRYRHVGIMNQKTWLNDILPLMRNLEKS